MSTPANAPYKIAQRRAEKAVKAVRYLVKTGMGNRKSLRASLSNTSTHNEKVSGSKPCRYKGKQAHSVNQYYKRHQLFS